MNGYEEEHSTDLPVRKGKFFSFFEEVKQIGMDVFLHMLMSDTQKNVAEKTGFPVHCVHKFARLYDVDSTPSGRKVYAEAERKSEGELDAIRKQMWEDAGKDGVYVTLSWTGYGSSFLHWALYRAGYEKGMKLFRKEKEKGFYPANCYFAFSEGGAE